MAVLFQRYRDLARRHRLDHRVVAAYLAVVALFLLAIAQFYIPGKGFSYLIAFGSSQEGTRISKVRRIDHHVERFSDGYDAQYYVQIAMDPSLQNRELRQGVDNLAYRSRRILFAATAYLLGLGQPDGILQAYAIQNVVAWLLLAVLLLHWFPPTDWDRFLRWAGVLLSSGMCLSVRNALFDGPSLLLVAFGVYLLEKGRPWWSTLVLALDGLGKETNLLGSAALAPRGGEGSGAWARAILRGLLTVLPLGLWLVYINVRVGPAIDAGIRNFALPFTGYVHHWRDVVQGWPNVSWIDPGPLWALLCLVGLTVQFLYLMLRPRWNEAWWRVGLSFAVLMIVLGDAVWEGYPGASTRVLLPMQLAFNVLVPAGPAWRVVLLAGNLGLLGASSTMQAPLDEGLIKGSSELLFNRQGDMLGSQLDQNWYMPERVGSDTWIWTKGSAEITIESPQSQEIEFRLRFGLATAGHRLIRVVLNDTEVWRTNISDRDVLTASLSGLRLRPGRNRLGFISDEPSRKVGTDPRLLSFCVRNFRIDLQRMPPVDPTR
jgi:hypothetical protein